MVIQSLTVQWQEAAIRGYDPNRHGLESPEAERANRNRNNQFKQIKEQHSEENVRKNGDGALEFHKDDHMAGTYKYSAETMALYNQVNREYEDFSNKYNDEYVEEMIAGAEEREANAQANYYHLLNNGIELKSGKTVWYDKKQDLFFDKNLSPASELEDKEARQTLDHSKYELDKATSYKERVEGWVERKEALSQRWEEIQEMKGKVPEEEYKKLLIDFKRELKELKADAPSIAEVHELDKSYEEKLTKETSSDSRNESIEDIERNPPPRHLSSSLFTAGDVASYQGIEANGIDPTASFNYAAALPLPPPPQSAASTLASSEPEKQMGATGAFKPGGYT